MKRSTVITLIILLLILLCVGWFAWQTFNKSEIDPTIVSPAAQALAPTATSSTYTDFNGNQADLARHQNKVIVAHSWASWVPTSDRTLRELSALQAQYPDDVQVLAINRAERQRTAQQFIEQVGVTNIELIADPTDYYFETIGGQAMPETVFYDVAGNIVHHKRGVISATELQRYTDIALQVREEVGQ